MTLTTLSSKELKPLYKWALKRNKSVMIIYSLFLLVFGPILNMYIISSSSSYGSAYEELSIITLVLYQMIAAFFTFVSSLKTFSYLHNKRSVDMFGALPANRTTMYVSHLLAGLTSISGPYFVMSILTLGITTRTGDMLKFGLYTVGTTLLMIIAAYVFTSLIAYCCGTVIDTAIVTIGANAIWVGIIGIYYGFITEMIPGVDFEAIIDTPLLVLFAPYGFSIMGTVYYEMEQTGSLVTLLIWNLIFIAGMLFLALLAANKRKAETSQNGFAVKWLPMVIKAGASVVCGGFIGVIAAEVADSGYNNMFVFCFWYVIIGLVAFTILHIIFARGFKGKLLPSLFTYLGTTAAAIAVLFGFSFGMGMDTYVPNPATVKSVTFDNTEFKDPENIKTITEIHKVITAGIRYENEYPYYLGDDNYSYDPYYTKSYYDDTYADDELYTDNVYSNSKTTTNNYYLVNQANCSFIYKRKVGFGVTRYYYMYVNNERKNYYDYDKMNDLLTKLYSSEEYKKIANQDLFDDEATANIVSADLNYFYYTGYGKTSDYVSSGIANLSTDETFMQGFREALRQDILEDPEYLPNVRINYYKDNYGDLSLRLGDRCIELHTVYKYEKEGSMPTFNSNYDYSPNYNDRTYTVTTLIKGSYKNTYKYLSDHQVVPEVIDNYSDSAFSYPQSYYEFCEDGRPDTLRKLTEDVSIEFAITACSTVYGIDPNEWLDKNYNDYKDALLKKSDELYKKYFDDLETPDEPETKYFSGYDEYYDQYYDEYSEPIYTKQADNILNELLAFSFEYVEKSVNKKSVV